MIKFVFRKLIILPFALLAVNFLGFAYATFARWVQAGRNPYFAVSDRLDPVFPMYGSYLRDALKSGFGEMPTAHGMTILRTILEASQASLGLLAIAFVISVIVGLFLGIRAARHDPAKVSWWMAPLSTLGLALPSFYIGALLIAASVYYLFWLRSGSKLPFPLHGFGWDNHLVLPVTALVVHPIFQIAQMTSILIVSELNKQYVVAARSLGNPWSLIRRRHVLRNVAAPVVLTITGSLRVLITELILVEWLFGWPGLGRVLASTLIPPAIVSAGGGAFGPPTYLHPALVATLLTVFALLFLGLDLITSVLVRVLDPRLLRADAEIENV